MKTKKIFLFFLLLVFSLGILIETEARETVEVSPFRIEEVVEPGERVSGFITVGNPSDREKVFYTFVKDFVPRGERGGVRLLPAGSQEGPFLSSWVDIPKEGVVFAPGEKKQIEVSFRVPQNIGPGGYYGAVVFGPKPPQIEEGEGSVVAFAHQAGVLVLFQVKGDVYHEARVREFATDYNFYENPFAVNFTTRVENLGNVHIKPVGTIKIENMRGSEVAVLPVNEIGANALPESIRLFENKWEGDFGLGKYTANLVLSFGGLGGDTGVGIRTVTAQTTFWIIPWDIVIPAGVGLFVFVLIVVFVSRWYKNKAIREVLRQAGLEEDIGSLGTKEKTVLKRKEEERKKEVSSSPMNSFLFLVAVIISVILAGGLIFFLFFA